MARHARTEILANAIEPLLDAIGCVTEVPLSIPNLTRGHEPAHETDLTLTLWGNKPVPLRGPHAVQLAIAHVLRLTRTGEAELGSIRAVTTLYQYRVLSRDGNELLAYQWTPEAEAPLRTFPHLHVGSHVTRESGFLPKRFNRLHLPTGRVSLAAIIRFLIEDLDVEPIINRAQAMERLAQSEAAFQPQALPD